jgi:hypothetical protein
MVMLSRTPVAGSGSLVEAAGEVGTEGEVGASADDGAVEEAATGATAGRLAGVLLAGAAAVATGRWGNAGGTAEGRAAAAAPATLEGLCADIGGSESGGGTMSFADAGFIGGGTGGSPRCAAAPFSASRTAIALAVSLLVNKPMLISCRLL